MILTHSSALQKACCHAGPYAHETRSADTLSSACLPYVLAGPTQDLLCWAPEQFQNLLVITLSIHVNDLNVTAVHGRLQSLQHVSINFICIKGWIFEYILD
jgi:hypothetical protein